MRSTRSRGDEPVEPPSAIQERCWPTTAELVTLCAFGDSPSMRISGAQLRQSLQAVGFRPMEAREILRRSTLLVKHPSDTYTLRPFSISNPLRAG